jgi:hypothetical protein
MIYLHLAASATNDTDDLEYIVEEETEDLESDEEDTCVPKRVAVCRALPQMVTMTERKQK